jgi:hypothetical protein
MYRLLQFTRIHYYYANNIRISGVAGLIFHLT